MVKQPDSLQSRLSTVWNVESARELAAKYPLSLAGAAAALLLLIIIVVFFATSASADFQPVDSLNHEYNSNHIHGIAYDHEQERLLIATHFGLFAWEDDQLFQVGDTRDDLMGLTMNPQDPQEVYLSGHPQGGGNLGVMRSLDGGVTLERIFTGVEDETVDFHSMSVSPADPDWLYGFFNGQIYRTLDGGETWHAFVAAGVAQQGLCWGVPCLAASIDDPATLYAGTAQGLLKSTDGGARFDMVNFEIGQTAAVAVDSGDPERIVAYTEALGVSVTPDGGGRWQSLNGDLPPVDQLGVVFQIAINATDASHMFIATMDMQIYETTDAGETWQVIVQP